MLLRGVYLWYNKSKQGSRHKKGEGIVYNKETGKPLDKSYLECSLPKDIIESIELMNKSWERLDRGEEDLHWDCWWCQLSADINSAEVNQEISAEQAWYLRKKYLRMVREEM